jgi:hypothetical protein
MNIRNQKTGVCPWRIENGFIEKFELALGFAVLVWE